LLLPVTPGDYELLVAEPQAGVLLQHFLRPHAGYGSSVVVAAPREDHVKPALTEVRVLEFRYCSSCSAR